MRIRSSSPSPWLPSSKTRTKHKETQLARLAVAQPPLAPTQQSKNEFEPKGGTPFRAEKMQYSHKKTFDLTLAIWHIWFVKIEKKGSRARYPPRKPKLFWFLATDLFDKAQRRESARKRRARVWGSFEGLWARYPPRKPKAFCFWRAILERAAKRRPGALLSMCCAAGKEVLEWNLGFRVIRRAVVGSEVLDWNFNFGTNPKGMDFGRLLALCGRGRDKGVVDDGAPCSGTASSSTRSSGTRLRHPTTLIQPHPRSILLEALNPKP